MKTTHPEAPRGLAVGAGGSGPSAQKQNAPPLPAIRHFSTCVDPNAFNLVVRRAVLCAPQRALPPNRLGNNTPVGITC